LGNPPELAAMAVNMSLVGFGNKRYGAYKTKDGQIDIKNTFGRYRVLHDNPTGAGLKEDDLTPNRLCRFYRYTTQKFIQETGQTSFLWRKYSPREDRMRDTCFRGGEYLETLTSKITMEGLKNMINKIDLSHHLLHGYFVIKWDPVCLENPNYPITNFCGSFSPNT